MILAFAGSNSSTSINYKLVKYTIGLIEGHQVQRMNMADYPFEMYSADVERKNGFSNSLVELKNDISNADALIISVNEHNGHLSAYFKNVLDWLSRIERKFLTDKKIFLMSTSPGKGGGKNALEIADKMLSRFGGTILSSFSLPSFNDYFNGNEGIQDVELSEHHQNALTEFLKSL